MILRLITTALLACALVAPTAALERSQLEVCARMKDDAERLACFDRLVPAPETPAEAIQRDSAAVVPNELGAGSPIGERWSIGVPSQETIFDIRPHKPTYFLLGRWTNEVNQQPASPTQGVSDFDDPLDSVEAKYQISFKFKLADMTESVGASLWAGYSQQSQWQVYNDSISRPFRETNYEPELMLAFHPDLAWGGWRWRLLNLGLVHQSNGRADPLSRSWNRVYAQLGVERGNLMLLGRAWYRLPEDDGEDNNPDIEHYLGHSDLLVAWRGGGHVLSAQTRLNLASGNGSVQATWSFPLVRRVNGYLQLFSGYGESMIDYNHYQNTIGIGFSLADWL